MQERTASEQDSCRKERMQDRLDAGRMQYRAAVGQVRGRIGRMKDRKDAEQDGCSVAILGHLCVTSSLMQ